MDKKRALKIGKFVLRWGIAVLGIWYVISRMTWNSRVLAILPGDTRPTSVVLAQPAQEDSPIFVVIDPSGKQISLPHSAIVNAPDKTNLKVQIDRATDYVLAVDLASDLHSAKNLLIATTPDGPGVWVPASTALDYKVTVPHPRVQIGVIQMVRQANPWLLLGAFLVIPLTILITSFRWHELLKALDIHLTLGRTFVLNMVGLFYNSFMPGSTGGDLLKAYYVAKQTHHRTRAVMSVIVDRVIGLLALIILGGTMASLQWDNLQCRRVAMGAMAIIFCVVFGMTIFYNARLRRITGLDFIITRLPMQNQVHKAIETMHIFGKRPKLVAGALIISFPVHMVIIISTMLAGMAFSLPIHPFYYWMAVPVIVLAGSIPISPQGAGVMEYFAIILLEPLGVSVGQAFAVTMSIRLTQIFWNLTGGYFVLRGGYHAPTQTEQQQLEREDEDKGSVEGPDADDGKEDGGREDAGGNPPLTGSVSPQAK
jgi:uncharacterized protein (TIRG00374 family)